MSAKYTIRRTQAAIFELEIPDWYSVVNPSGVEIAHGCSWRVARKIADALNGIQFQQLLLARLETELALIEARAVSLQEEA